MSFSTTAAAATTARVAAAAAAYAAALPAALTLPPLPAKPTATMVALAALPPL